jgi:sec-independent protein translocase protein TatA
MTAMTHALVLPLVFDLGAPELLIIFAVIVLLFGAAKLPELARGSGRALRIFKAETKGLMDDDEDEKKGTTPEQRQIDAQNTTATDITPQPGQQQANPEDTRPPGTV